jgi:hypothetical protein
MEKQRNAKIRMKEFILLKVKILIRRRRIKMANKEKNK